jgi:hypothetical protein
MIEKSQTEKWLGVWKGLARFVPWIQGLYYTISGMWAQVSIDTFMMVTGPKTDIWLVKVARHSEIRLNRPCFTRPSMFK